MICQTCLKRMRLAKPLSTSLRTFTTSSVSRAGTGAPATPAERGTPSGSHEGPPAAISTSAAQPFSSKLNHVAQPSVLPSTPAEKPKSSVPAGTVLKGLGFVKNKDLPKAMEDNEYPVWLWGLLKTEGGSKTSDSDAGGDLYAKTRKQRRSAAKAARKAALKNPESNIPKIPLEQQTIDLASGDGTIEGAIKALEARDDLTHAMRKARRKDIKESNFLRAM